MISMKAASAARYAAHSVCLAGLMMITNPGWATNSLSLLTYNIHSGIPMGVNSSEYTITDVDMKRLSDLVTTSGADIVAMQEVRNRFTPRGDKQTPVPGLPQPNRLAELTGMSYVFGSCIDDSKGYPANTDYMEWGRSDGVTSQGAAPGEYGNCVLVRGEFAAKPENIALPTAENTEPRAVIRVELKHGETPVVVYATHFVPEGIQLRMAQMRTILERATKENPAAVVFIMGDLNWVPGAPGEILDQAREHGFRDLHQAFASAGGRAAEATHPADNPDVRIDYILCNKPVVVKDAEVIPTTGSDHRPLLVRVELP